MEPTEKIKQFKGFLEGFYGANLLEKERRGVDHLVIDYKKLMRDNIELADEVVADPEETLKAFSIAATEIAPDLPKSFSIRIKNLVHTKLEINKLRSKHLDKFITVEGNIKQKSDVKPQVTSTRFECPSCGNVLHVLQLDERRYKEPTKCGCGRKGKFVILSEESIDVFSVLLEETTEFVSGGSKLSKIKVLCSVDLSNPEIERSMNQGGRVEITGTLKKVMVILQGTKTAKMDWWLDANYVKIYDETFMNIKWSNKDLAAFKELANSKDWLARLRKSIFYDVYGYEEECEGIILQMFGGVGKDRAGAQVRGSIHILLVGDPGASKSSMLKIAQKFHPKARYVAGKGTSGVGLTAAVVKDELLGGFVAEAGAIVLSNNGVLMIDELDKISDDDKNALHEPLEEECYHPDTEIFIGGEKQKMGEYVDKIIGKNNQTEIKAPHKASVLGLPHSFFPERTTTDYVYKKRHTDPLIRFNLSNGRVLCVTKNHPMYVFDVKGPGLVKEKRASEITTEDCLPCLNTRFPEPVYPLITKKGILGRKKLQFPTSFFAEGLPYFLGFFAAEGHIYHGKHNNSYEVGVSTTDLTQKKKVVNLIKGLFGITPSINVSKKEADTLRKKDKYTIRILGIEFYTWFVRNFPELSKNCKEKRIPKQAFSHSVAAGKFLRGAFDGDGSYKTRQYEISTCNKLLAEDYQDLLLVLGIHTTITSYKYEGIIYYKVSVLGNSNTRFARVFKKKIKNKRDFVVPNEINILIKSLLKRAGIINTGRTHRKNKGNVGVKIINNELNKIEKKISLTKKIQNAKTISGVLSVTNHSVRQIGILLGFSQGLLYPVLKRNEQSQKIYLKKIKTAIITEFEIIGKVVTDIRTILNLYCWIRPLATTEEKNHPGWVYDINIPKGHTFFSNGGMMLHNTVTISKGNVQATMLAKTSVLGAANPKFGSYSDYDSIYSQIDLSPTLINRFDLVYPIRDSKLTVEDHYRIAMKILGRRDVDETKEGEFPKKFIKKYIAYAKTIRPKIPQKIQVYIAKKYQGLTQLRKEAVEKGGKTIPITARNVDGFRRVVEAVAKSRLNDEVTMGDADIGYGKVIYSLKQVGIDPDSGDAFGTFEESVSDRKTYTRKDLFARITRLVRERTEKGGMLKGSELESILKSEGYDKDTIDDAVEKLKREGELVEQKRDEFRIGGPI